MNKLLALADRVEKLTGPDREVDAEIWWHVGPGRTECTGYSGQSAVVAAGYYFGRNALTPEADLTMADVGYSGPQYTASMDAAMKLVPGGAGFNLDRYWIREGARWKVEISTGGTPAIPRMVFDCWDAHSEPLAIVAASLRARAHGGGKHD